MSVDTEQRQFPGSGRRPHVAEVVVFAILLGWLAMAVSLVDIEYYDGFDSICNARYFLGWIDTYTATRGPLFGLLLVPAELIKGRMGLPPLEVRPHHVLFALLHAGYLIGCYLMARRFFKERGPVLLAFVAAIPTFLFFGYAPFVSHDLFPGLVFLWMLLAVDRFVREPRTALWWGLVLVGAVGPLIKDTYVIFWIIALATQALLAIGDRRGKRSGGSMLRRFGALVGAAAASAIVTVVVLGWALRGVYPEVPFLLRGFRQAVFLLFDAGVKTIEQPAWVYLRNLPAFGLLALALLPFGLMRSWKESRTQRGLVLAWVLAIAAVHLLSLRQVRYLLFVAPVTVFLIVPAARMVWSRRWMAWAAAGIWSIGFLPIQPYAIANAMTKIATPFYRHSEAKEFLEPLHEGDHYRAPIWVNWGLLSFCPPGDTPLAGDVYADLFHLGPHHLADLFPYRPNDVVYLDPQTLPSLPSWPEEAVFIATTRAPQFNPVTWHRGPAGDKFDQEQMVFLARSIVVQPAAGDSTNPSRWVTGDGQPVRIDSATTAGGEAFSVLSSPAFPEDLSPLMPMRALFASSNGIYPVGELGAGKWAIPGTLPAEPRPSSTERVTFRFFERVRHLQYGQTDQD